MTSLFGSVDDYDYDDYDDDDGENDEDDVDDDNVNDATNAETVVEVRLSDETQWKAEVERHIRRI